MGSSEAMVPTPTDGSRRSNGSGSQGLATRWWLLGAAILVVLLLAGTRWFLRDYRPGLEAGERYGLDVSHHQGRIDWSAVADDNIDFVYIKATEGGSWIDPRFVENWNGAKAAGLDVAAYHFFTLCRSGREQATNFLANVPVAEADMPLALDLEFAGECENPIDPADLPLQVAEFIDLVEDETGSDMLIYLLDDFDEEYRLSEGIDRPRWIRSLFQRPDEEWHVWQYSFTAHVDGIEGGVDLNIGAGEPGA